MRVVGHGQRAPFLILRDVIVHVKGATDQNNKAFLEQIKDVYSWQQHMTTTKISARANAIDCDEHLRDRWRCVAKWAPHGRGESNGAAGRAGGACHDPITIVAMVDDVRAEARRGGCRSQKGRSRGHGASLQHLCTIRRA